MLPCILGALSRYYRPERLSSPHETFSALVLMEGSQPSITFNRYRGMPGHLQARGAMGTALPGFLILVVPVTSTP